MNPEDELMPFGCHKGKKLSQVPHDYLKWMDRTIADKTELIAKVRLVLAAADFVRERMPLVKQSALRAEWKLKKEYTPKLTFKQFMQDEGDAARVCVILKALSESSQSNLRTFEDIDCSMNLWIYRGKVYAILYGEHYLWDKFKPPKGVEDYAYWNNTDGPDDVSRRAWHARSKTWNKVCLDSDWDSSRMVHDVIKCSKETGLYRVVEQLVHKDQIFLALRF